MGLQQEHEVPTSLRLAIQVHRSLPCGVHAETDTLQGLALRLARAGALPPRCLQGLAEDWRTALECANASAVAVVHGAAGEGKQRLAELAARAMAGATPVCAEARVRGGART